MTIGLVATLHVWPGMESDFEATFRELQAAVRANEPGCLQYDLFRANAEAPTYVVMEQYTDQDALERHGKTAHYREIGPRMTPFMSANPDLAFMQKIS